MKDLLSENYNVQLVNSGVKVFDLVEVSSSDLIQLDNF